MNINILHWDRELNTDAQNTKQKCLPLYGHVRPVSFCRHAADPYGIKQGLFTAQIISKRMADDELRRMWKETVIAKCKVWQN